MKVLLFNQTNSLHKIVPYLYFCRITICIINKKILFTCRVWPWSVTYLDHMWCPAGGYDRGECLQTVESYDLHLNKWMPLQQMLTPRGRFDSAVIDGKVYACGGSNGSQDLMSAECYDPSTDQWAALPDMQISRCSPGRQGLLWGGVGDRPQSTLSL